MKVGDIVYTSNDNHKARPDILGHKVFAIGETYVLVQSGHGSLNLSAGADVEELQSVVEDAVEDLLEESDEGL